DDEQRDAQRPARNPLERVRCDHRPQENTNQHEAQAREDQRYLHGTARKYGDRDRQHRARNQSAWKADEIESYSPHRGNEQRPHNLHELAQWGNRRRHGLVPDARVAGQGASRGALLITDQCRLRCAASNGGPSATSHQNSPRHPGGECRQAASDILPAPCGGKKASWGFASPRPRENIMLQGWIFIAVPLGYIGLLLVVASYGARPRRFGREGGWRHFIYPLSLAI